MHFNHCVSPSVHGQLVKMLITLEHMVYLDQICIPMYVNNVPFFDHFVPSNNYFVPRSFCTHFGHLVPSSTGYEMTFESQFVPKSFRTYFGHFVHTLVISYLGSVHIKCISLNTYFSCEHDFSCEHEYVCLYILYLFH